MTLPGTHARLLAVTWGKPVSGCFSGLWLDWIFFLAFWPVGFGSLPAHRFFASFFSFWSPIHFWVVCCSFAMGVECVKTCVIHASEMMASYDKDRVIVLLRERIDFERLSAIQFCPRGLIRITFKNASDKEDFARMGSLVLDGHDLSVTSSDKPPSLVYVHYFPAEGDDALIRDELSKYGEVIGIKHQNFSGIPGLLTGSRILTMVLSDPVPAEFRIDDYPVRVWYRGIPPFCQICKVNGHKAADCQFNGKCRRCGSPDHKAHACVRPWGQSAVPTEAAVPEVVPDPSVAVVPVISDSSVALDESVVEDVVVEDVVTDSVEEEEVSVSSPVKGGEVVNVEDVALVEDDVGPSRNVLSPVVSCENLTPEHRNEFRLMYRNTLCQVSGEDTFVFLYGDDEVCGVFPADDPEEVRITFVNGASSVVHANLVEISHTGTSDTKSGDEYAQFLLRIKDDPSYRISFRGSIVEAVGPTEHCNVLWAKFTDHSGPQCLKLSASAFAYQKLAHISNSSVNKASSPSTGAVSDSSGSQSRTSSGANVNTSSNKVNIVNKSSSTADESMVNVSRNSSRSVVPTAAVLAAELLKRTTPPSVVGVPKCRKKF